MSTANLEPNPKYLYLISSRREFFELSDMELRHLFNEPHNGSYHLTNEYIDISRSTFIKSVVTILYFDNDINDIEKKMLDDKLEYNNYKIHYSKVDDVPYQIRLDSMRKLGFAIEGDFAIKHPEIEFLLTRINGMWIFGLLKNNLHNWRSRRKKLHNYSHALDIRIAKAVINIAIDNNFDSTIVDPCSGSGTIIIEGRDMGLDIKGYEINPLVKQHCNFNLEHFGFAPDVVKYDMLHLKEHFDIAILDLPYGHSSLITRNEQIKLIKKVKEISNKAIIITMDDMSDVLIDIGYEITDQCKIKKSNVFSRYINLCK